MQAGRLRHRVRLLKKKAAGTADAFGVPTPEWETFRDSVPASIQSAATVENTASNQKEAAVTHMIKMRYTPDVETAMRVYWPAEDRTFDIGAIKRDRTLRRDILLRCVEKEGA